MITIEDIKKKKYAVMEYSGEDYWEYSVMSLHDTKDKATKRCNYLNKRNEGLKYFIGSYFVITTEELLTNKKYVYIIDYFTKEVEQ